MGGFLALLCALSVFSPSMGVVDPAPADAAAAPDTLPTVSVDDTGAVEWEPRIGVAAVEYREVETAAAWLPAVAPSGDAPRSMIVGGGLIGISHHRYAVKVFVMDGPFSVAECGGVVVAPDRILTAAHCTEVRRADGTVVPASEWGIVAGLADWTDFEQDRSRYLRFSDRAVVHPAWDRSQMAHDLAVLELDVPFEDVVVDSVPLFDLGPLADGDAAYAVGWGATVTGGLPTERLSGTGLRIAADCGAWTQVRAGWVSEGRLCAGGAPAGICQGDSGGPLVVNEDGVLYVAGLVSFNSTLGCGAAELPDVFTDIAAHADWIESVAGSTWTSLPLVAPGRVELRDPRPGRSYVVRRHLDDGRVATDVVTMPGIRLLGPADIGIDCRRPIAHPFTDVAPTSYAASSIGCLAALGVTTGTSASTFDPAGVVTREQMAALLARLYGVVTGEPCWEASPFVDVSVSSYAYGPVGCLAALGVTTGTSASTFSPGAVVTREQMAALLGRLYTVLTT